MYKCQTEHKISFMNFNQSCGMQLNPSNEWDQISNRRRVGKPALYCLAMEECKALGCNNKRPYDGRNAYRMGRFISRCIWCSAKQQSIFLHSAALKLYTGFIMSMISAVSPMTSRISESDL